MRLVLFGANGGASSLLFVLKKEVEVLAFVDNNPRLQGTVFCGYRVYNPDYLLEVEYDYVVISCVYGKEITQQLCDEYNIPHSKIIDYYDTSLFEETRVGMLGVCAQEINRKGIKGAVAELGVYRGDFAKYINYYFPDRKLFLFDTFQGFNKDDVARIESDISLKGTEFCDTNVEVVLSKMPFVEKCICKVGYFPDTATDLDEKFAFVSLDPDLYGPTYSGLMYFWPRMSKGGYIFVHDYNAGLYQEEIKRAIDDFSKQYEFKYVPINDIYGSLIICK